MVEYMKPQNEPDTRTSSKKQRQVVIQAEGSKHEKEGRIHEYLRWLLFHSSSCLHAFLVVIFIYVT